MDEPRNGPTAGETDGTPLDAPLAEFLDAKAKTTERVETDDGPERRRSGNYVNALERVVPQWIEWTEDRGVTTFEALDSRPLAQYAASLSRRVDARRANGEGDGITAATAWNYYSLVSAYLHYCMEWEYVDDNPARSAKAKDELPDRPRADSGEQQFWSAEQREELVRHVERRAGEAIDDDPDGRLSLTAARDRAFVYVIGFSGVRGAEVLASSRDDRRTGLSWNGVDTNREVVTVFGKSQQTEQAPLTDRPVSALERWKALLAPPTDEWPVFPSFHLPSLRETAGEQLRERGVDDEELAAVTGFDTSDLVDAFREYRLVPPALTTEGGRHVLRTLTEAAAIDCSSDPKDYLTLHGARRGAGEAYYDAVGAEAAQRALRHADPETTSKMYAHKEASELSAVGSDVFSEE